MLVDAPETFGGVPEEADRPAGFRDLPAIFGEVPEAFVDAPGSFGDAPATFGDATDEPEGTPVGAPAIGPSDFEGSVF